MCRVAGSLRAINLMFGGPRAVTSENFLNLLTRHFMFLISLQKSLTAAGASVKNVFAKRGKARDKATRLHICCGTACGTAFNLFQEMPIEILKHKG